MTTKTEQERNLINLRRSKVSELLAKGHTNQSEISKILNVSEPTISRDITYINQRSEETFNTYQKKIPQEFCKTVDTFDLAIRMATHIFETTQDEKTKLAATKEMREARNAKMEFLSNHDVMAYQVNKNKEPVSSQHRENIEEDTEDLKSDHREEEELEHEDA